jgi:osmotically inducible protein OsmC
MIKRDLYPPRDRAGNGTRMEQQRAGVHWGAPSREAADVAVQRGGQEGLVVDLPNRRGEARGKTSPEDLIDATHATCHTMALVALLAHERTPPAGLDVDVVATLESVGDERRSTRVQLGARGRVPGADGDAFAGALRRAKEQCVVSRARSDSVVISAAAVLEPDVAVEHVGL